jgi:hypothetical protein
VYSVRAYDPGRRAAAIAVAAGFFSLAIVAKPTAVFGVLGVAAAFALNGRRKSAGVLAAATLGSATILLLAANAASDGRMIETMRACATGGAVLWNYVHAPLAFVYTLVHLDPMSVVISTLFFAGLIALPQSGWKEIPTAVAVASLAMLVALNATPGIDFNHFLDFFGFALIFVGYQVVAADPRAVGDAGVVDCRVVLRWSVFHDIRKRAAPMAARRWPPAVVLNWHRSGNWRRFFDNLPSRH